MVRVLPPKTTGDALSIPENVIFTPAGSAVDRLGMSSAQHPTLVAASNVPVMVAKSVTIGESGEPWVSHLMRYTSAGRPLNNAEPSAGETNIACPLITGVIVGLPYEILIQSPHITNFVVLSVGFSVSYTMSNLRPVSSPARG